MGAITYQSESAVQSLGNVFEIPYRKDDYDSEVNHYRNSAPSNRLARLQTIYAILDNYHVDYEKGREPDYYQRLGADIDFDVTERKILTALFDCYRNYRKPEDFLARTVRALQSEEDEAWNKEPLRVQILRRFAKYGNYLSDAGFGGRNMIRQYVRSRSGNHADLKDAEIPDRIDDSIFELLKTCNPDAKKPKGSCGLLKAVDDLAAGRFPAGGPTKKLLYLFALAYEMTFYYGAEGQIYNEKTDLEKNLFRDYYINNLIRFIGSGFGPEMGGYDLDPAGTGINYKNYAEWVYLYYLVSHYPPAEKIRLASAMIEELKSEGISRKKKASGSAEKETQYFYALGKKDCFTYDEKDFKEFLMKDFVLPEKSSDSALLMGVNRRTAMRKYTEIVREYNEMVAEGDEGLEGIGEEIAGLHDEDVLGEVFRRIYSIDLADHSVPRNYGLWFMESHQTQGALRDLIDCEKGEEEQRDGFIAVLKWFDSFLSRSTGGVRAILSISDPAKITRTAMLAAFHYRYNAQTDSDSSRFCLKKIIDDYRMQLNPILTECHFQPFSEKNFVDILFISSSYSYFNE